MPLQTFAECSLWVKFRTRCSLSNGPAPQIDSGGHIPGVCRGSRVPGLGREEEGPGEGRLLRGSGPELDVEG